MCKREAVHYLIFEIQKVSFITGSTQENSELLPIKTRHKKNFSTFFDFLMIFTDFSHHFQNVIWRAVWLYSGGKNGFIVIVSSLEDTIHSIEHNKNKNKEKKFSSFFRIFWKFFFWLILRHQEPIFCQTFLKSA